ncbi:DNA double-strand break repair protein Mre11 [uncultured archaeon]|nr:DNA double-strand break repair protein Mre11 [uncultured archaeon]
MVRFAHISDVHLGGWKQQPMQDLNFASFRMAVDTCIKSNLDFVLIAGDLFDSAYPPIEILKETFSEFKRLKDARIPVFLIAGSHDYSVSGKTFLDVLERAGFCKNVTNAEYKEVEDRITLNPTVYKEVAIYGYPGKKSGLEIQDLRKIKFNDAPGLFKIFMLHTTLDKAVGSIPMDSIEAVFLPPADYYALGHLHIDFQYENFVYPGPVFPNNFQELEDLKWGSFYIVDTKTNQGQVLEKVELKIKDVVSFEIAVNDASAATDKILAELEKKDIEDKIVLIRISGEIENGSISDIKFAQIEDFVKNKGAYFLLRNTHDLTTKEVELEIEIKSSENVEEESIKVYSEKNPSDFNEIIPQLMSTLTLEKMEGEKNETFSMRLVEETKKILKF